MAMMRCDYVWSDYLQHVTMLCGSNSNISKLQFLAETVGNTMFSLVSIKQSKLNRIQNNILWDIL